MPFRSFSTWLYILYTQFATCIRNIIWISMLLSDTSPSLSPCFFVFHFALAGSTRSYISSFIINRSILYFLTLFTVSIFSISLFYSVTHFEPCSLILLIVLTHQSPRMLLIVLLILRIYLFSFIFLWGDSKIYRVLDVP